MGAPLLSSFLTKLMAEVAAAVGSTIVAAEAGRGWWCVRLMCCGKSSTSFWQMGQRVTLRLSKCCFVGSDTAAEVSSSNAMELSGASVWKLKKKQEMSKRNRHSSIEEEQFHLQIQIQIYTN